MRVARVFLSYPRANPAEVAEVHGFVASLKEAGLDVWMDSQGLHPGEVFDEVIAQEIRDRPDFVLVVGRAGLGPYQEREVAFARALQDNTRRLVPVLLHGAKPPGGFLGRRHATPVAEVARLVRVLRGLPAPRTGGQCPYRGTAPYGIEDSEWYFGRERATVELIAAVHQHRFVYVSGASGSGKSSVVLAGLGSDLARRDIRLAVARASSAPAYRAASVLLPDALMADADFLATKWRGATNATAADEMAALAASRLSGPVVLYVDQGEELLGPLVPGEDRPAFMRGLAALARAGVSVVVSVRLDERERFLACFDAADRKAPHELNVDGMRADELEDAIVRPALAAGGSIEPAVVGALVEQALDRPGNLPLLQLALCELWKRADGRIGWEHWRELEGLRWSVRSVARSALARLSEAPGSEDLAAAVFRRLVWRGPGGVRLRRRSPLAELVSLGPSVPAIVEAFRAERLVVVGEEPALVEVAHEAILDAWDHFSPWLQAHEDDLLWQALRLDTDAAAADPRWLLPAPRLAALTGLQDRMRLAPDEQALIARSLEAQRRERTFRIGLLSVAVLAMLALAGMTFRAQELARVSRARELAAIATSALREDGFIALRIAWEALRVADLPETRRALVHAALANRVVAARAGASGNVVYPSPNLHVILTVSGASPENWHASAPVLLPLIPEAAGFSWGRAWVPTNPRGARWSRDSRRVAVGGADVIVVSDVGGAVSTLRRSVDLRGAEPQDWGLSPDGSRLAVLTSPSVSLDVSTPEGGCSFSVYDVVSGSRLGGVPTSCVRGGGPLPSDGSQVAWSLSGRLVAFSSGLCGLGIVQEDGRPSGAAIRLCDKDDDAAQFLNPFRWLEGDALEVAAPGGRVVLRRTGAEWLVGQAEGEPVVTVHQGSGCGRYLGGAASWSEDGTRAAQVCDGELRVLEEAPPVFEGLCASCDGAWVEQGEFRWQDAGRPAELRVWDRSGALLIKWTAPTGVIVDEYWRASARQLDFAVRAKDGPLQRWSWSPDVGLQPVVPGDPRCGAPREWSADGEYVAVRALASTPVCDAAGAAVTELPSGSAFRWSPHGHTVIYRTPPQAEPVGSAGHWTVWTPGAGAPREIAGSTGEAAWAPDGTAFFFQTTDGIARAPLTDLESTLLLPVASDEAVSLVEATDRVFAVVNHGPGPRELVAWRPDGTEIHRAEGMFPEPIAYYPGLNRYLCSGSALLDPTTWKAWGWAEGTRTPADSLSPEGTLLVAVGHDGYARVSTGPGDSGMEWPLVDVKGSFNNILWHPDGDLLLLVENPDTHQRAWRQVPPTWEELLGWGPAQERLPLSADQRRQWLNEE